MRAIHCFSIRFLYHFLQIFPWRKPLHSIVVFFKSTFRFLKPFVVIFYRKCFLWFASRLRCFTFISLLLYSKAEMFHCYENRSAFLPSRYNLFHRLIGIFPIIRFNFQLSCILLRWRRRFNWTWLRLRTCFFKGFKTASKLFASLAPTHFP